MPDEIIAHPTYMEHIRHFFDEIDLDHMNGQGVDLSTYGLLSARANDVYLHTLQPDGDMPPDDDRKWSAERSASFLNWINDGLPIGVPSPAAVQTTAAGRIRKDAASLTADEVTTLTEAFQGLINRDPADPQGYFALAGQHWFPPPNECKHHNDLYLPWHRVFVRRFEDALRSVPGCADVTLPYWDITTQPPDFLFAPPFAAYTSPVEIMAPQYPAGYTTSRFDAPTIAQQVTTNAIPQTIADALTKFRWGTHIRAIWGAHDTGHPSCGPSMSTPDVAAFDPIFWFFHTNWDRLWWEWQQIMQATTYWTFRSTIFGSPAFLQAPLNTLAPFTETADMTIALISRRVTTPVPPGRRPRPAGRAGRGVRQPRRRAERAGSGSTPGLGDGEGHRPTLHSGHLPRNAESRRRSAGTPVLLPGHRTPHMRCLPQRPRRRSHLRRRLRPRRRQATDR